LRLVEQASRWLYDSRRKLATAGVAALAILLAYHVVFGANGMMIYTKKRAEYRKLNTDIEQLQQENQRLQKRVDELKHDPKAIEKEAREQLKYARPGEVVYSTAAPANQPPASATAKK
jgi:cell division protein FtsB